MPDKHQAELASLLQSLCDLQERATRLELKFLGSLLEAAIIETALQGKAGATSTTPRPVLIFCSG